MFHHSVLKCQSRKQSDSIPLFPDLLQCNGWRHWLGCCAVNVNRDLDWKNLLVAVILALTRLLQHSSTEQRASSVGPAKTTAPGVLHVQQLLENVVGPISPSVGGGSRSNLNQSIAYGPRLLQSRPRPPPSTFDPAWWARNSWLSILCTTTAGSTDMAAIDCCRSLPKPRWSSVGSQ